MVPRHEIIHVRAIGFDVRCALEELFCLSRKDELVISSIALAFSFVARLLPSAWGHTLVHAICFNSTIRMGEGVLQLGDL